jgi:hypothetical protein
MKTSKLSRKFFPLMFLVFWSFCAHAEQAAECKEAIRTFNKAHTPAEIGVYIHDGQVDAVVSVPEGHRLGSSGGVGVTQTLRVCIATGAFSNTVWDLKKGAAKAHRVCSVTNATKMANVCDKSDAPIKFKAVK